jgi:MFS family permease
LFYAAALMPDVLPATKPWFYYTVIFTTGIARGFLQPSITALFAQVLPRELYANGAAWNTNTWQSAAVAGPAAGGMVLAFFSNATAFGIVLAVSVASWIVLALMPRYALVVTPTKDSIVKSIGDGVKFVLHNQVLLGALTLDLVAVLFAGAMAVLPIFASEVLNVGPEGLGYLRGAPFLGSVMMGFFMATRRPMKNAGKNMIFAVSAFGLCLILFAWSTNFWLSMFLLMLSGVFDNISVVTRSTILQLSTPEHMRGRVSSVNNLFVGTSNELGAFVAGVNAKLLGIVLSVTVGGSISIVAAAVTAWKAPRLRNLNLRELQSQ